MKAGQAASTVLLAGAAHGVERRRRTVITAGKGGDAVCKGEAGTPW